MPVYPDMYKRSIFFEILSLDSSGNPIALKESFAFTLPPSNIDISQTQRVTKTPTPGGFFIDNYGMGSARINISGETGNSDSRLTILGPGKTPVYLTGQECYFEMRNRIERYSSSQDGLSKPYMIRFYDLTNNGSVNIFSKRYAGERARKYSEAWEVVWDESSSRRSSAKPLFYGYGISLTGIRPLGTYNPDAAKTETSFLSSVSGVIDSATEKVEALSAKLDLFLSNTLEYANDVADIASSISEFSNSLTMFGDQVLEYEQKIGGLFEEVASSTFDVLNDGLTIISFPYDVAKTTLDVANSIVDKVNALAAELVANGQAVVDKYNWNNNLDPASELSEAAADVQIAFNPVIKYGKQSAGYEPIGAIAINGVVTPVYGYYVYDVSENTRLDRLALQTLGDPDLKEVISAINGIYANDELVVGDKILIPNLTASVRFSNNAVYYEPGSKGSLFGRDILIKEDGSIGISANDYATTNGMDTLYQAISMRLKEKRGRQIRNQLFGISTQIGDALDDDAPLELLAAALEETLVQDPRIISVYDVDYSVRGDSVFQDFKFDTISALTGEYSGGLT